MTLRNRHALSSPFSATTRTFFISVNSAAPPTHYVGSTCRGCHTFCDMLSMAAIWLACEIGHMLK